MEFAINFTIKLPQTVAISLKWKIQPSCSKNGGNFAAQFHWKHIVFQPNVWKVYKNSPLNLVKSVGFEGKIKLIKDKEKKSTRTITISLRTSFRSIIYLINLSTSTKFVVERLCKALSLVLQSQLHIKKYVDLK